MTRRLAGHRTIASCLSMLQVLLPSCWTRWTECERTHYSSLVLIWCGSPHSPSCAGRIFKCIPRLHFEARDAAMYRLRLDIKAPWRFNLLHPSSARWTRKFWPTTSRRASDALRPAWRRGCSPVKWRRGTDGDIRWRGRSGVGRAVSHYLGFYFTAFPLFRFMQTTRYFRTWCQDSGFSFFRLCYLCTTCVNMTRGQRCGSCKTAHFAS